jgi:hypothetical protein
VRNLPVLCGASVPVSICKILTFFKVNILLKKCINTKKVDKFYSLQLLLEHFSHIMNGYQVIL